MQAVAHSHAKLLRERQLEESSRFLELLLEARVGDAVTADCAHSMITGAQLSVRSTMCGPWI